MPEISRKHKISPYVDWEKRDLFIKLLANPNPVFAVFPKDKKKPCIHIKGGTLKTDREIEKHLKRIPENSLGVILGVAKPEPEDWATNPNNRNKAGYVKAWGASDNHIDYLNVFVVEGDPDNMSPDEQVSCIEKAGLPKASFTVLSGNRSVHHYWLVGKVPADKWKNIQERLIELLQQKVPTLQVDSSIKNPARVMRCVGGRHSKTNKFCEFKDFSYGEYSWEYFDKLLPALPEKKRRDFISDTARKDYGSDKGWLDRLKDKPEEQKKLVVEMLKHIPIHEGAGMGRRNKICIPVLAGLVNEFGNEAISICNEAGWYGDKWDPEYEMQYLQEQRAGLGTVVEWARKCGWVHPYEIAKPEPAKDIKIVDFFPTEVSNSISTVTAYLPHKDSLKILTFLHAVAPLIRLGTKINCIPTTGFIVPLNLYGCVIGQSGSKKSPLFRALLQNPLKEVKKELARENYKAGQQFALDLADFKNNGGDRPEKPPYPIITTRDSTRESLEKQLMDNEKAKLGLLRFSDELAAIFKSFNQYNQGRGSDEEFYLELYDGGAFHSGRMEENRSVDESAVSVFGGAQPEVLKKLHKGKDDNGLWSRIIFDYCAASPTRLPTSATTEEISKFRKAESYLSFFISEVKDFKIDDDLELTQEAMKRFSDYELERQKLAAKKNIKSAHANTYNKSAGKVGRVAGILWIMHQVQEKIKNKISQGDSYVDLPPGNLVDISIINNAIELVNYWDSVSINVADEGSENSIDIILRRLLAIAEKCKGKVPFSEIYKKLSFTHRKIYTYDKICEHIKKLEELGLGSVSKGPREGLMFKAEKPWPND